MSDLQNDSPEIPKKKKKSKIKNSIEKLKTPSLSASATSFSSNSEAPNAEAPNAEAPNAELPNSEVNVPEEMAFSDEFLKHLEDSLKEVIKLENENEKEIENYAPLELMVTQYLKSFLIIGFGLNGEKVFLGHAKTAEEHDSLVEHLRRTFAGVMQNIN